MALARREARIPIVVLVRPRAGDFLYSPVEIEAIEHDIRAARDAGADGVAIGALTSDGALDRAQMERLVAVARPLPVTLHRAFDVTRDPIEALEDAAACGVDRVLTSGQERSAPEGIALLAALVQAARGRVEIMAGAGVNEANVRRVVEATGVREVHFSASVEVPSAMRFHNPRASMGAGPQGGNDRRVADAERVRRLIAALA